MWKVETAGLGSQPIYPPLEIRLNALESNGWEIYDLLIQQLQPDDGGLPKVHIVARKPILKETREPGEDD
jgi:hypothetical protein